MINKLSCSHADLSNARINMNDYLSLPVVSAIGGSWLATKQQIADKQWDVITAQVKEALAKAAEVVG